MAMTFYTGWQYLLIDAASHFGLDKLRFEERIQWAQTHLHELEALADQADTRPLYLKAVLAIRKAQAGIPTGHLVGVDASCSGIQIMSALTGCVAGATATNLVDPNKRADAYTECTALMNEILGSSLQVNRKDAKQSLMTVMYGSKAKPKEIFGEDTPELEAFYMAAQSLAPGAWELLQDLLGSWQSYALLHEWLLPDGFHARIKVMQPKEIRVEIDELDHATFTYLYYDNKGIPRGHRDSKSNAANVVHSVDAYVLRCMHRRCNYDRAMVERAQTLIEMELLARNLGEPRTATSLTSKAKEYLDHYTRSNVADIVILPYLDAESIQLISDDHLDALGTIVQGMLQYAPFPLVTIHDEFKAHPNNVNWVRWQYKEILAELAGSSLIDDILNQIHDTSGTVPKLSSHLPSLIRDSNYALC